MSRFQREADGLSMTGGGSNLVNPISPKVAIERKIVSIPDEVIESFNELISEKLNSSGCATFKQDDIVERIMTKFNLKNKMMTRSKLFDNKWLDIENLFTQHGWKVEYDSPGYNESYAAVFKFSPKKKA